MPNLLLIRGGLNAGRLWRAALAVSDSGPLEVY